MSSKTYTYYGGPMPSSGASNGASHTVVSGSASIPHTIRLTTGGTTGYYSVSTATLTTGSTLTSYGIQMGGSVTPNLSSNVGELTIKTKSKVWIETEDGSRFELMESLRLVREVADRLKVLAPILEKHEVYPALASAFDRYRVVERLCRDDEP